MSDIESILSKLSDSSDFDMTSEPRIVASTTEYTGAIFSVDENQVEMRRRDGSTKTIKRQVVRHQPAVVLLVHDCERDLYLLEREYRAGSNTYAFGVPAGLIDSGEDPRTAAFRELEEETAIKAEADDVMVDKIGSFYSSEGMTDELVTVMVLHLRRWVYTHTNFDPGEVVESTWVSWEDLNAIGMRSSNSIIALKHEALRRLTKPEN